MVYYEAETAAKDEKVSGKSRKRADKKPTNPEIDDQPTENNAEEENISGKSRKDANKYPTMPTFSSFAAVSAD
jgi:hypothetical protein